MATPGSLTNVGQAEVQSDNVRSMARLNQVPDDLMTKCESCGTVLVTKDWLRDLKVCSRCGYHEHLTSQERIDLLTDADSFTEWN